MYVIDNMVSCSTVSHLLNGVYSFKYFSLFFKTNLAFHNLKLICALKCDKL